LIVSSEAVAKAGAALCARCAHSVTTSVPVPDALISVPTGDCTMRQPTARVSRLGVRCVAL